MATTTLSSSPIQPHGHRLGGYATTAARDAAYLLAGLPAGVIAFSVLVTGLSLAGGLAITLLGIPVLLATLYVARWMGDGEAWRAARAGVPIERARRPWTGGVVARTKTAATDLGAWRDTLWGLLLLPIGIAGFTIATTAWATALGLLTSPAWYWALPDNDDQPSEVLNYLTSHAAGASAVRAVVGALLVPIAYWACRGTTTATLRAAGALLQG
jgi:hypothetical protein